MIKDVIVRERAALPAIAIVELGFLQQPHSGSVSSILAD